jgi:ribosomal protein L37AE/L43A
MTTKRQCKQCDCKTIQTATYDWQSLGGEVAIWKCENCDLTTPRLTRRSKKQKALDQLFDELCAE